jgi:hypothetical protein
MARRTTLYSGEKEQAMRITSLILIGSIASLVVVALTAVYWVVGRGYAAVLTRVGSIGAPSYVHAGVPFWVRDSYATQICISTRSGRPLLPFVAPAVRFGSGASAGTPANIQAGMPFVVRDQLGSQYCISSRGGEPLPPFILP